MVHVRRLAAPLALALAACAPMTSAPSGFLPSPQSAGRDAWGGWAELEVTTDSAGRRTSASVTGELLAFDRDSVFVLQEAGFRAVPLGRVTRGSVTGWRAQVGEIAGWTGAGVLSTLSNGWILIVTAPLWVIVGTATAAHASYAPYVRFAPGGMETWRRYCRFPAGLPPGIDRSTLKFPGV